MNGWEDRPVLVTGGNGFIGSHLVEMLVERGARVTSTASSRETEFRFLDGVRDRIRTVVGDLADPSVAARAVRGQDCVFHLAARVGGLEYNMAHPASIFIENMRPFMSVIEAARDAQVARFVVTSSACVYPRHCSIPTPETEGFAATPEPTNEGYGWAKRMEEFLGRAFSEQYGMSVRIARPYNCYGPRDDFDPASSHVIAALVRRVLEGEDPLVVWGDGSASRSFLYVTDFARGLIAVAEHSPRVEAINIGADEETTIRELAGLIVRLSGRDTQIRFDPSKPAGQPRRRCDTRLAEKLLGFRTGVSLEQGLAWTIDYYREDLLGGHASHGS
jgi:GDP-L-fucose synthase